MMVVETGSGKPYRVAIGRVSPNDLKRLNKTKYSFAWRQIAKQHLLFKLTIVGRDEILGVMALHDHPEDSRIEIKLIASSKENVGRGKKFEGIVDCFLAFACAESLKNYGEAACVSLLPKTVLKRYYIKRYGMIDGGRQLFLEGKPLFDWAKRSF